MFTSNHIKQKLASAFSDQQADMLAEVVTDAYNTLVKASDFGELKAIVAELAVAQQRTEQRVGELVAAQQRTEQRVGELAAAQQRTEQRVAELAVAQQRTEQRMDQLVGRIDQLVGRMDQLTERMDQLTERIDQLVGRMDQLTERMDQLTERMDQLTERMDQLAAAQQRTEQTVRELVIRMDQLVEEHRDTRRQLGGLSMSFGYHLENIAYRALPQLLADDYGLIVEGRLKRGYVTDDRGRSVEINILGTARQDERTVTIIGESKSQLSHNDIDDFFQRRVQHLKGTFPNIFPILVTHMTSGPDVESYARQQGVALYFSYDFA